MLVARLLLAQIFIMSGVSKLGAGYAATAAYMHAAGVSPGLLPLVIALELGGGLAIVAGFFTRAAALALALFSVVSAALFHTKFSNQTQAILFMKDLAMAGGLLLIVVHGPGSLSVQGAGSPAPE